MNDFLVYSGLLALAIGVTVMIRPLVSLRIERRRTGGLLLVLGLATAVLGAMRSDDGTEPGANHMLVDDFLPVYDFNDIHAVRIHAPPEHIFHALKTVKASDLGIGSAVVAGIRSLPHYLTRPHRSSSRPQKPILEQSPESWWVPLAEEEGRELVVGFVGRFWKIRDPEFANIADSQEFLVFDRSGYAKAAINFHIGDMNEGWCRLTTETRILPIDPVARKRFGLYWNVIHPGVAIIRRDLLRAIKRRAERAHLQDQQISQGLILERPLAVAA